MIDVHVIGGTTLSKAIVTQRGQLVTSPLDFSSFYTATTVSANVAVNVIPPRAGKNFIITSICLSGDRNIGANGAVTSIFENATGPTNATVTKAIYIDEIAKQTRAILTNLNIIVTAGRWINVKSDDVQVRVNIAGYYTAALDL